MYKARDKYSGKVVAMKKVRFDTSEPESVKFMAREIRILRRLDHPNIVKLEGLATSRMHYSIYLVFDYMQSDLATIINRPGDRLTEPQVRNGEPAVSFNFEEKKKMIFWLLILLCS